jgi:hypothetical protein
MIYGHTHGPRVDPWARTLTVGHPGGPWCMYGPTLTLQQPGGVSRCLLTKYWP